MERAEVIERIGAAGLVAVLRDRDAGLFDKVGEVLADSGVSCIEFTLNTPGAVEALRRFGDRLPDGVLLGAGTVLDRQMVDAAVDAGATYLISPTVEPDV